MKQYVELSAVFPTRAKIASEKLNKRLVISVTLGPKPAQDITHRG